MSHSSVRRFGAVAALVIVLGLLLVPAASASSTASGCQPVCYTVRVGDTLTRIAARYGVTIQALMAANGIANPNVIYAGRTLVIPGKCTPPPAPGPHPHPEPWRPGSCSASYTVVRGDTLTRIAWRFGTTIANLQRCNGIANPNRIYAGQRLCICGGAWRPTPTPDTSKAGPWRAQYFNNKDLSGSQVLERNESQLDHNWGYSSPAAQVYADGFSARWQQTLKFATGTYRVTVTADDGVRLSIDNVLVIDAWKVQPATTYQQDVIVMGGMHTITVEYFENDQVAEIHFSMPKIAN